MIDPNYDAFLQQQFMNRGPLTDIPGRPLAMPPAPQQPPSPQPMGMTGIPNFAGAPQAAPQAAPPQPIGQGLPKQITRPRNQDIFGSYVSTYDAGRQMGQEPAPLQPGQPGWGQPAPEEASPFYLSHTGQTQPGGMNQGQDFGGQVDPRDAEMARRFPRAHALQQRLNQMRAMQSMQPQLEADLARQKADTELSLMKQKGAMEQETMQRKFQMTEAQMDQQQRKSDMQMRQQAMQQRMAPQPQSVRPPR